jgi:hypothetical protein
MKNLFLLVLLSFSVVVTAQTNTKNYQEYDNLMHCSHLDTMQMSSSHNDLNCCNTCLSNVILDNVSLIAYVIFNSLIVNNKITNQYISLIQEIVTPPPTV